MRPQHYSRYLPFKTSSDHCYLLTFSDHLTKRSCLAIYNRVDLGKIVIINTLVASLVMYKLQVLPKLESGYVNRFNDMIEHFLWNGSKPKIAIKILQLDK